MNRIHSLCIGISLASAVGLGACIIGPKQDDPYESAPGAADTGTVALDQDASDKAPDATSSIPDGGGGGADTASPADAGGDARSDGAEIGDAPSDAPDAPSDAAGDAKSDVTAEGG